MPLISEITKIFERDLDRLQNEIKEFNQESNLWKTTANIQNSAGNLSLHLVGNLRTFIGKNIGNYDYIRNREAEFSLKDVPRQQLLDQVEEVKKILTSSLNQIDDDAIDNFHIEHVLGKEMTNTFLLLHLASHLSYHLGQINYLRRILEP